MHTGKKSLADEAGFFFVEGFLARHEDDALFAAFRREYCRSTEASRTAGNSGANPNLVLYMCYCTSSRFALFGANPCTFLVLCPADQGSWRGVLDTVRPV